MPVSDSEWQAYLAKRNSRRRTNLPEPKFIEVYGMQGAMKSQVDKAMTKYLNKPIDTEKIEKTITDLQGTGLYSSISYNLIDKDDETGLLVRPRPKNYGPPFLNLGVFLSSNNSNEIQFGFGGRATFLRACGSRVGGPCGCRRRTGGRDLRGALQTDYPRGNGSSLLRGHITRTP